MPTRLRLLAATLAIVVPTAAFADTPTIALSGEGRVSVVPDTAVVRLGVVDEATTAGEALDHNNRSMKAAMEALTGAGVAARDVGTAQFSVEPVTVYPPAKPDGTQEPPRITGYRVTNEIAVRIRDIATAGGLLDNVVRVGANSVRSIDFVVADADAALASAREKAFADVRAKADLYAKAGGFHLGRILSVSETSGMPPERPMFKALSASVAADRVPLAAGEQDVVVTVNVSWEIDQPPAGAPAP